MSAQTLNYRQLFNITPPVGSPPAAPTNLVLTVLSASAIQLDWQNNDGGQATGIKMDISTDNVNWTTIWGFGSVPSFLNPTITEYVQTGLTGNTQYFFRVAAFNSNGTSSFATGPATTLVQGTPTAAPTNFQVTGITANSVSLSWTAATGSNTYAIDMSLDGKTGWLGVLSFANSTGGVAFTVKGLAPSTTYFFRLHGVAFGLGAGGGSPPSPYTGIITATTPAGSGPVTKFVSPTGLDSNSGDIGTPWLTIAHALASVTPGSTINLRAGTYAQTSTLNVTLSNLTIQAYQSEAVFITGSFSGNPLLWMSSTGPASSIGGLNVCLRRLDLGGSGTVFYVVKFEIGGFNYLYLTDLACVQNSTTVTSTNGGFNSGMVGSYLTVLTEGTGGNFIPGVYLITGFTDAHTITLEASPATAGTGAKGAALVGGSILDSCTIHNSAAHVVKSATPGSSNIYAHNCTVNHSASNASGFDMVTGWNQVVQDCTLTNCGDSVGGTAIDFKGGSRYSLAQRNRIDTCGYGVWLGQSTDADLFDQTVNTVPYEAISCVARNNKISNCQFAGLFSEGSLLCEMYNNTLYHVALVQSTAAIYFKDQDTLGFQQCKSPIVRNNIVQQLSTTTRDIVAFHNDGPLGTPIFDHNIYWIEGGGSLKFDGGGGSGSLNWTTWRQTGNPTFDTNGSLNSDPVLNVTGSPPNLDLSAGSPGISAGATIVASDYLLPAFSDDIHHTIRPKGAAWDIGADEF